MPIITDNFEEDNSKYAVITSKVNKDYPKVISSLKEKKRTWQLMLATLFKGNKENGTEKVNESCETRFDFKFNQENASGLWNISFMRYVNETLTETSSGTVVIDQDIHEEQYTVIVSKSKTKQSIYEPILVGAIVLFVGMILVVLNKNQSQKSEEE